MRPTKTRTGLQPTIVEGKTSAKHTPFTKCNRCLRSAIFLGVIATAFVFGLQSWGEEEGGLTRSFGAMGLNTTLFEYSTVEHIPASPSSQPSSPLASLRLYVAQSLELSTHVTLKRRKAPLPPDASFKWDRAPQFLTVSRAFGNAVSTDGNLFLIGGCQYYNAVMDTHCSVTGVIEVYNTRSGDWLRSDLLKRLGYGLIAFGGSFAFAGTSEVTGDPVIYIAPAGSGRLDAKAADAFHTLLSFYAVSWPAASVGAPSSDAIVNGSLLALKECDFKMNIPRYAATWFGFADSIFVVGGIDAMSDTPALSFEQHAMCCDSLGDCPQHATVLFNMGRLSPDILSIANTSITSPITFGTLGTVLAVGTIRVVIMTSSSATCRTMFPVGTIVVFRSVRLLFNLGDVMLLSVLRCDESIIASVVYPPEPTSNAPAPMPLATDPVFAAPNIEHPNASSSLLSQRAEVHAIVSSGKERVVEVPSPSSFVCNADTACSMSLLNTNKAVEWRDGVAEGGGAHTALTLEEMARRNGTSVSTVIQSSPALRDGRSSLRSDHRPPVSVTTTSALQAQGPTLTTHTPLHVNFYTADGRLVVHSVPFPPASSGEVDADAMMREMQALIRGSLMPPSTLSNNETTSTSPPPPHMAGASNVFDPPMPFSTSSVPNAVIVYDQFIIPFNRTTVLVCAFFGGCETAVASLEVIGGSEWVVVGGSVWQLGGVLTTEPQPSMVAGILLDVAPTNALFSLPDIRYQQPNDELLVWQCNSASPTCNDAMGLVVAVSDSGCTFGYESITSKSAGKGTTHINISAVKKTLPHTYFCVYKVSCPAPPTVINTTLCTRKQTLDPSLCIMKDQCPVTDATGVVYCCDRQSDNVPPSGYLTLQPLSPQSITIIPFVAPSTVITDDNWYFEHAAYFILIVYACCGVVLLMTGLLFLRYYGMAKRLQRGGEDDEGLAFKHGGNAKRSRRRGGGAAPSFDDLETGTAISLKTNKDRSIATSNNSRKKNSIATSVMIPSSNASILARNLAMEASAEDPSSSNSHHNIHSFSRSEGGASSDGGVMAEGRKPSGKTLSKGNATSTKDNTASSSMVGGGTKKDLLLPPALSSSNATSATTSGAIASFSQRLGNDKKTTTPTTPNISSPNPIVNPTLQQQQSTAASGKPPKHSALSSVSSMATATTTEGLSKKRSANNSFRKSSANGSPLMLGASTASAPSAVKKKPSSRSSLKRQPVYLGGYRIVDVIGEGSYGVVLRGIRKADKQTVAIKFMVCQSDADRQKAMKEYRIIKKFQGHPNIVQISDLFINWEEEDHPMTLPPLRSDSNSNSMVGASSPATTFASKSEELSGSLGADELKVVLRSPRFVCIVLEYFPAGDLKRFLQLYPDPLVPERVSLRIMHQIANALRGLHTQTPPVAHRDLKPDNILVDAKQNRILLSDFGLATEITDGSTNYSKAGTPLYLAPETVAGRGGGKEVDLWALGCLGYALATRRVGHENARVMFRELKEMGVAEAMRHEMRHYSNEYVDLTFALLSFDPAMRPSAGHVHAICTNMLSQQAADGSSGGSGSANVSIIPPRQMEALMTKGLV